MKRAWLIALMVTMMSASSTFAAPKNAKAEAAKAAGNEDDGEPRTERRLEAMATELKLSRSQQAQVRKILEESREKQREAMKAARKEMNEKRKALREETDAKIAAVLKADQKQKFDEMKSKRSEKKMPKDAADR